MPLAHPSTAAPSTAALPALAPDAAATITLDDTPRAAAPSRPTVTALSCRACGATQPVAPSYVCDRCFAPVEVVYDPEVTGQVTRARIEAGPASLWRYHDLLPVLSPDPGHRVDLGAGFTPLREAPRLAEALGLRELWLKDDTANPSGSFKDRVVSVALSAARALGIDTVACASTGNLANSVAAHAAAAGLPAYVLIPHDLEEAKIVASAVYGAKVIAVDGSYDDVNRLSAELADERGWGFVNINLRPFYSEGSKTIGFEIAEQLGWSLPDHVVLPVASGSMLTKVHKAFGELRRHGLVDDALPRISGAQPTGCSPVAEAFARGANEVHPHKADTIVRSLAIGTPADGADVLAVTAATGGAVGHVSDDEVVAAIGLLARTEGLFAETAGGVTVATLARLVRDGLVDRDEQVVAVISGSGYKTIDALRASYGPSLQVSASLRGLLRALDAAGS